MINKILNDLDDKLEEVRAEVEIYGTISPENEEEEKKAFEDRMKGKAPSGFEGSENFSSEVDDTVNEMCGDSVTNNISPEDVPTEALDSVSDPEFRYEEGTEEVHKYARLSRELSELEAELEDVDISEVEESNTSNGVISLYQDTIDEVHDLLDIAKTIKNPNINVKANDIVPGASSSIYGKPSKSTVEWAERTLKQTHPTDDNRYTEGEYSTGKMVETLQKTTEQLGMDDWDVDTMDKGFVNVNAADKQIKVPEDREFTENEAMRLLVHEIGSHTLRGANGREQDNKVLGAGAGGYHATGEGVALYLEKETDLSNPNTIRKYAGRVKSIQSVLDGDDFTDTYKMNIENGFDHDKAWSMSVRAHRGGGFIKDHVYAEGMRMVEAYIKDKEELDNTSGIEEYADMDGNLEDLLVGKISVDQAEELSEMEAEYKTTDIIENMDYITPEGVDTSVVDSEVDHGNSNMAGA